MKRRYITLKGEDLEIYSRIAARLILGAKLNRFYPDPFGCSERLRFLAPSARAGLSRGMRLDRASGLPWLKDVMSVQVDRSLAEGFLARNEARLEGGRASQRLRDKAEYYRKLTRTHLPPFTRLDVRLREVFPERLTASFETVFDRFDPGEGVFVRTTLLLEETHRFWGGSLIERDDADTQQTPAFRELMQKLARDESEIMFLLLGKRKGIRVLEVTRGRIGPLWSPWAPGPSGWFPEDPKGAFVLHCPLDNASVDREEDTDQDPFAVIFREGLSRESRPLVEEAARKLGYRVSKERLFACTRRADKPLRAGLKKAGFRCILRTI